MFSLQSIFLVFLTLSSSSSALVPPSNLDKGFNLLEIASGVLPQGQIVNAAKETWKFAWKRMMAELAPQDKEGSYQRPSYKFHSAQIGTAQHPDEVNRYHVYLGNPCPWCHRVRLAVNLLGLEDGMGLTILEDNPDGENIDNNPDEEAEEEDKDQGIVNSLFWEFPGAV